MIQIEDKSINKQERIMTDIQSYEQETAKGLEARLLAAVKYLKERDAGLDRLIREDLATMTVSTSISESDFYSEIQKLHSSCHEHELMDRMDELGIMPSALRAWLEERGVPEHPLARAGMLQMVVSAAVDA